MPPKRRKPPDSDSEREKETPLLDDSQEKNPNPMAQRSTEGRQPAQGGCHWPARPPSPSLLVSLAPLTTMRRVGIYMEVVNSA
jgi:hypothetical protein